MAKFIGSIAHSALIYLPHLLAFGAFGVMLGGIATLQARRRGENAAGSGGAEQSMHAVIYIHNASTISMTRLHFPPQNRCGRTGLNAFTAMGTVNYMAPVRKQALYCPCSHDHGPRL